MSMSANTPNTPDKVSNEKLKEITAVLRKMGIDYVVTRQDSCIAHLNIWIGKD